MNAQQIANEAATLSDRLAMLAAQAGQLADQAAPVAAAAEPFLYLLTIFLMACFVGYYVVWSVTPALHSPLMGVTNAISSVIVVGAILATGLSDSVAAKFFGFLAVTLASVNIFGGFMVTRRMLAMFKKKGT
jgi:NAD(P) transhydrogenase subunit alpha